MADDPGLAAGIEAIRLTQHRAGTHLIQTDDFAANYEVGTGAVDLAFLVVDVLAAADRARAETGWVPPWMQKRGYYANGYLHDEADHEAPDDHSAPYCTPDCVPVYVVRRTEPETT